MEYDAPYPCVKCGEMKFPKKRCKACNRAKQRIYYHRDIDAARAKNRAKPSSHNRIERNRRDYETHRDAILDKSREWHRANPAMANSKRQRWRVKNPDKVAAQQHRRRARIVGADGSFTSQEWSEIKSRQSNSCFDCGRDDVDLTVGHLVPLCLGGRNSADNIVAQCQSCNSRQGKRLHKSVKPVVASIHHSL